MVVGNRLADHAASQPPGGDEREFRAVYRTRCSSGSGKNERARSDDRTVRHAAAVRSETSARTQPLCAAERKLIIGMDLQVETQKRILQRAPRGVLLRRHAVLEHLVGL